MPALNFRASQELLDLLTLAQGGEAGNQSAALRALLLLGAARLGLDLSALQHEIVMLMMEPLDPKLAEALRTLIGGIPTTLPQRPTRGPAETPAPRRTAGRGARAAPPAEAFAPPPAHRGRVPAITSTLPASLGMASNTYDIGEEI